MNSQLSHETEKAIINCAHRFDGYAYAKAIKPEQDSFPTLTEMYKWVEGKGKMLPDQLENFALNFYLHRMFHHWGWLPSAFTPEWYQMLFFYLHLYRLPTPAKYRHGMAEDWEKRRKGAAEAAATEIRLKLMERAAEGERRR